MSLRCHRSAGLRSAVNSRAFPGCVRAPLTVSCATQPRRAARPFLQATQQQAPAAASSIQPASAAQSTEHNADREASTFWAGIRQAHEAGADVVVTVTAVSRAEEDTRLRGLHVTYERLAGVMSGCIGGLEADEALVGRQLLSKVSRIDEDKGVLEFKYKPIQNPDGLEVSKVVAAKVVSLRPYGVFLDLGSGNSALLRREHISHEQFGDMPDILPVGTELQVLILAVDSSSGRVQVSSKVLEPTPGDMIRDPQRVWDMAYLMATRYRTMGEWVPVWGNAGSSA